MPRVIACLLRHLPLLQVHFVGHSNMIVILSFHWMSLSPTSTTKHALTIKTSIDILIDKVVDLANLHPGIEHYYRGTSNSKWLPMLEVVKAWWKEKCFIRWCQLPLFARRRRPAAPPRLRQAAQPGPLHRLRSSCSGEHIVWRSPISKECQHKSEIPKENAARTSRGLALQTYSLNSIQPWRTK